MFLDRDGTINREVENLTEVEQFELLPGVGEALARLQTAGYLLVVVTNQSAIARGMLDEQGLARIHSRMERDLAAHGVHLDHVGYSPFHPTLGASPFRRESDCRKPAPGLLLAADRELGIDFARSWIVGDARRDLEAGAALDVRGILVATGKGEREAAAARAEGRAPERFVPDLAAAADLILGD